MGLMEFFILALSILVGMWGFRVFHTTGSV